MNARERAVQRLMPDTTADELDRLRKSGWQITVQNASAIDGWTVHLWNRDRATSATNQSIATALSEAVAATS